MRAFLTIIVPLILPTAAYLLWALAMRRIETAGTGDLLRGLPWVWLVPTGVLLVALVLVVVQVGFGGTGAGEYVPPQVKDGKLVPGHFEPARP